MSETLNEPRTLDELLETGEVTGALILSEELRETITPRELALVSQAFEAGIRIGKAAASTSRSPS